jgi:UDP-N-acetylglucosamine diphosphorylase / glucose-1-phosphate thymidylyltransferase / UDP-N-acetylgalactosamine diphosphorylase / glucosamine-1-phosphate N-acetyltransferase / galactosamine-1-phosphate N-acetyltransferase
MKPITAIIIAGGSNSRFYPLNTTLHKGGFSLLGQPLIHRTLDNLVNNNINQIICVVSPKDSNDQGLSHIISQSPHANKVTLVTQPEPTGMGDAVLKAAKHIQSDQFLVLSPYHTSAGAIATQLTNLHTPSAVCTITTKTPWEYGVISQQDNLATGIVEKPPQGQEPSDQRVQSIYLLNQDYLQTLKDQPPDHYNFELALNLHMQSHPVGILKLDQKLPSLKYAWNLFDIFYNLIDQFKSHTHPSATIAPTAVIDDSKGPVIIDQNATINHAARIVGPCYIGPNAFIGDFSLIRIANIEQDAVVGSNTEVVRSLIFNNATIHYSYLADSILGPHTKIAAGLITANRRFDRQPIKVTINDKRVNTGHTALGLITGEHVTTGIRLSTMPGTIIKANQTTPPNSTLRSGNKIPSPFQGEG